MINQNYGKIFKNLRQQQGISLSYFSSLGLSKTTVSEFECGKRMPSFDKVVKLIHSLGISLSDFEMTTQNFQQARLQKLFYDLENAVIKNNIEEIKIIKKTAKEYSEYTLSNAINILLNQSSNDDIENLTNFLYSIKIWTLQN